MRTVAVSLLSFACFLAAPAKRETYQPKDDLFSISFPGHPSETSQKIPTGATINSAVFATDEGVVFTISYGDTGMKKVPTETGKDEYFQGVVKGLKGTPLSEKRLTIGGHSGKEYLLKVNDSVLVRVQVYLVNTRTYMLMVGSREEADVKSPVADQFFSSFAFPQGMPAVQVPETFAYKLGEFLGFALIIGLVLWIWKGTRSRKRTSP
jgi:hypothetical protein